MEWDPVMQSFFNALQIAFEVVSVTTHQVFFQYTFFRMADLCALAPSPPQVRQCQELGTLPLGWLRWVPMGAQQLLWSQPPPQPGKPAQKTSMLAGLEAVVN